MSPLRSHSRVGGGERERGGRRSEPGPHTLWVPAGSAVLTFHGSKIPRWRKPPILRPQWEDSRVFNIPSPYGPMLLILETSPLVPKPEDRGRDKAQRRTKNEKRERWRGRVGAGKNKYCSSSPFEPESEVRLDRGQALPVRLGFSPWERRTAHIWLPQLRRAPCRPDHTVPPAGELDSSAQEPSGVPLGRFGEGLIWGGTPTPLPKRRLQGQGFAEASSPGTPPSCAEPVCLLVCFCLSVCCLPARGGASGLLVAQSSVCLLSLPWTGTLVGRGREVAPLRLARGRSLTHSQPLWSTEKSNYWLVRLSPKSSSQLLFLECQQCARGGAHRVVHSAPLHPHTALRGRHNYSCSTDRGTQRPAWGLPQVTTSASGL